MPIITQSILCVYAHCVVLTYNVKRFRVILLYLALYKCYNNNNNNNVFIALSKLTGLKSTSPVYRLVE